MEVRIERDDGGAAETPRERGVTEGLTPDTGPDARLDAEFNYVIGRTVLHDVTADGQLIARAHTEVTAAEATAALAAGVLEDLAMAVGGGDPSKTTIHASAEDVDYTPTGPDPDE
jgi:hypothetical protein